jgi:nucleoside-diphosphate-sugar epimerase
MAEAFVTGGSGFLGRNLITTLLGQGMCVHALARSEAAVAVVADLGAEPVRGDLDDAAALNAGMARCDIVFHLAARTNDWGRYEDAYRANVTGTEHVLTAARAASVPRLVHVSTEAVLVGDGRDYRPLVHVDETRPRLRRPLGLYALTYRARRPRPSGLGMNDPLPSPQQNAMLLVSSCSRPGASWRGVRLLEAPGLSRGEVSLKG